MARLGLGLRSLVGDEKIDPEKISKSTIARLIKSEETFREQHAETKSMRTTMKTTSGYTLCRDGGRSCRLV